MRILAYVIDRRWIVVIAAVATLGTCVPLFKAVPKGFLPKNDEGQFEITVRTPEGNSLASTALAAERIARAVHEWPEVAATLMTIGDNNEKTPNLAKVFVRLVPPDHRKLSQDQLQDKVRREIVSKQPPEYRISVLAVSAFSGGGFSSATVQYTMTGPDLAGLTTYSAQVVKTLKAIPGSVDVDTTLVTGNPEVVAVVNRRKAADLGVNVADVATAAQLLVGGVKVSRYEEEGRQYDILVRADEQFHTSTEALSLLSVPSSRLGSVPLLDVVDLSHAEGPSQINRYGRQRQVTFLANTAPGVGAGEVGTALEKAVAAMKLPAAYRFVPMGQSKEIGRTAKNFGIAFALAFVFMYLILAAQFESWLHPVTILLALPLTVPFALMSLLLFGQSLDLFTMLGVLVLFGVVKKNSILQIDHINQLRAAGRSRRDAILHRKSRSVAADLDDDDGVRRRHVAAGAVARDRRRVQPRDRRAGGRRSGPVAAADAAGDAGRLLAVRRPVGQVPARVPHPRPLARGDRRRRDHGAARARRARRRRGQRQVAAPGGGGLVRRAVMMVSIIASLAVAVVAPRTHAAVETSGTPAPVELTLEQALAQARKRNHSLAVDRARLAQAQTNIEQAWAALFPTVAAQGKYTHNDYSTSMLTFRSQT